MKPKRAKRRAIRESVFGPERTIVLTADGTHQLNCGHFVEACKTERLGIKHRRCIRCLQEI